MRYDIKNSYSYDSLWPSRDMERYREHIKKKKPSYVIAFVLFIFSNASFLSLSFFVVVVFSAK